MRYLPDFRSPQPLFSKGRTRLISEPILRSPDSLATMAI
jgi:hypothetical protein